jgi:hypothetical protein
MRTFTICLLLLSIGFAGVAPASAMATGGWSQPVDISPDMDYRVFPDANEDATRVVFLDYNQYGQPLPLDNIRKIKVVEYQGGAWGSEILIGSNGHYAVDASFEAMPKVTKPVISENGNTIAYLGYTGDINHEYNIYYSDRSPGGTWSAPAVLPEGVMTTHNGELSLSQDGNILIQDSHPTSWFEDTKTYVSTRVGGVWGNPVLVYNGLYGFAYHLIFSVDGNRAAFVATYDLYLIQKTGDTWGAAVKIVDIDQAGNLEIEYPQFTADGKSIFYWEMYCAPISGGCERTNQNLKRIQDTGSGWSAPSQVAFSDIAGWGKFPNSPAAINASGTRAVFPVAGHLTGDFLYSTNLVTTDLKNGAWTTPALITLANDLDMYDHPLLSADGSRLVYVGPFSTGKTSTILFSTKTNVYSIFLPFVRR